MTIKPSGTKRCAESWAAKFGAIYLQLYVLCTSFPLLFDGLMTCPCDLNRSIIGAGRLSLRSAVEISRGAVPLLAFAAIHRQLHGVTIRSFERFIPMKQRLDPIVSRLQIGQRAQGITKSTRVNDCFLVGLQAVDVDPEDLLRIQVFINLKARLFGIVGGEQQQNPASMGARLLVPGKR